MRYRIAAALAALTMTVGGVVAVAPAEAAPVPATSAVQVGPLASAAPRHGCDFVVLKDTSGPGLRNYRAYDAYCNGAGYPGKWFGPWRFTRSGAAADGLKHLGQLS